jgi:L-fuconolactonase
LEAGPRAEHQLARSNAPDIVDAQLHELTPHASFGADAEADGLLAEILLASMDAVGVDSALINPTNVRPGIALAAGYPDRFRVVASIQPSAAGLDEQLKLAFGEPQVLALRLVIGRRPADPSGEIGRGAVENGEYESLFSACEERAMPLFVFATGILDTVARVARSYPDLQLIVDHLGLQQAPMDTPESPPWRSLPKVTKLAEHANVSLKLCGAPALSVTPYPYEDVWPNVRKLIGAFGHERLIWASDIGRFQGRIGWPNKVDYGRAFRGSHTYAESLGLFRHTQLLSPEERRCILGANVRRLLGWERPQESAPH